MREPITTPRLLLRDVTEADAERLLDLDSDPEVMRYIGPRPTDDAAWYLDRIRTVFLAWQAHPWHGIRMVHDRATDEFLGWVFIRPANASPIAAEIGWADPREMEVGYRFRRAAWGRGIATESATPLTALAVDDPATSAVVACAQSDNAGSLRVLEKLGLQRVGEVTLRDGGRPTVKLSRAIAPRTASSTIQSPRC
jgi:RimJ/RimL family protein N-acetyltransferase